jgi:hypothetical protein
MQNLNSQQDFSRLGAISLLFLAQMRLCLGGVEQSIVRWGSYANRRRFLVILVHPFPLL